MRKNNAFIDRRFGEDEEHLTQEEKALLRFQKQRMKDMAGSKFALPDDDDDFKDDTLTHMGRAVDDIEPDTAWLADEEEDQREQDLLDQFNFGGGEQQEENREAPRHKSKKEIMEEVIAKSKMYKALKAKQRDGDLEATDELDEAWKQLSHGDISRILRPKGSRYEENMKSKSLMTDEDKKFDALTRELVFEAKAQAGERTLTKEELAELEKQRLEELEKQRVAREKVGIRNYNISIQMPGVDTTPAVFSDDVVFFIGWR